MKSTKLFSQTILLLTVVSVSGCVSLQPPAPPPIPELPPLLNPTVIVAERQDETEVETEVVEAEPEGSCGSLHDFVLDIQKLEPKGRKELLDSLGSYEGGQFSCDRLKTGLLLSQIGKTVNEDSLAIEILSQYKNADKLDEDNQQLVQLLLFQSTERKRLHVLLSKLGERLVTEKSFSQSLSDNLFNLQQKMNQLQKLETDINETEQSIATPSTSALDTEPKADTDS